MNATNRAANRLLLVLVGILLLAAGAAAALLGTLPGFARGWREWAAGDPLPSWATTVVSGTASGGAIAVAAVALVVAPALVAVVLRQGRGHVAAVLDRRVSPAGRARIDLAIPRALLGEALGHRPDVLASRITAYAVRGTPALKISVRARRGASPLAVRDAVVDSLRALDEVLGEQLPAYVQISGGFRARSASRARTA